MIPTTLSITRNTIQRNSNRVLSGCCNAILFSSLKQNQNNILQSRNFTNFRPNAHEKKQSPEYHRNSTLYSVTPREALVKIEKEWVDVPRYAPKTISDYFARGAVWSLRKLSNLFFREKYIHYSIVLETVAAVPGMVGGMLQHLKCLRSMEHNNWIKILLDEAENERMHLITFMEISKPSMFERAMVAATQAIYWNIFLIFYLVSPRTAHRFTGYLEEEAVITYTNFLRDIDNGLVQNYPAPKISIDYWGLPSNATLRDLILVIRQDENDHRYVNHEISNKITVNNTDPIEFSCDEIKLAGKIEKVIEDKEKKN
eukprot:gene9187-11261_t